MKRNVNLVPWSDFLSYAVTIGYEWNQAHKILVDDEVPPMYENKYREYDLEEINNYGWSEDSFKIVKGFMDHHGVNEIVVVG